MKRDKNIKITPLTHDLLKKYCNEHGLKMFAYVESLIKKNCVSKPSSSSKDIYGEN
jgi:hypothetical protein